MKDYISGRDIDVQELMIVASIGERQAAADRLYMGGFFPGDLDLDNLSEYIGSCGTAGCLIGSYCCRKRDEWSRNFYATCDVRLICERFGLSYGEMSFLFFAGHLEGTRRAPEAADLPGQDAVRRLRKYMYYKMRKSELLADYETARRTGDIGIVADAVRESEHSLAFSA